MKSTPKRPSRDDRMFGAVWLGRGAYSGNSYHVLVWCGVGMIAITRAKLCASPLCVAHVRDNFRAAAMSHSLYSSWGYLDANAAIATAMLGTKC